MTPSPLRLTLFALFVALSGADRATAQPKPLIEGARGEPNVIYGMHSGLALLLDVHTPATPNGYGVIFISGSGWQAPTTYDAMPLKQNQIPIWGPPLLKAGYTVFALNHRAVPRFHGSTGRPRRRRTSHPRRRRPLLIHGDADDAVPFGASVAMEAALRTAGVPTGLVRVPGGGHGADFGAGGNPRPDWPDFLGDAVRWYDAHLKRR